MYIERLPRIISVAHARRSRLNEKTLRDILYLNYIQEFDEISRCSFRSVCVLSRQYGFDLFVRFTRYQIKFIRSLTRDGYRNRTG